MSSIFGSVLLTLAVFAIQLLLLRSVSSLNLTNEYLHHKCIDSQGKYKKGSLYEENLNSVIQFTTRGRLSDGFADSSSGKAPNTAYAQIQCRGDSYLAKCHSCLATAISELRKRCPGNKGAMIWYDQCLFKISSVDSYAYIDFKNSFYLSNPNKVSGNLELFNKETSAFLDKLALKATSKDNVDGILMVLYAAGEKRIGTNKLYAMVQCTKDLNFNTCYECLAWIFKQYPKCCDGKRGGRILSPNCNFRYEFYPFLRS